MNRPTNLIQDVATLRELCGAHHPHTPYEVQNYLNVIFWLTELEPNLPQPACETENAA